MGLGAANLRMSAAAPALPDPIDVLLEDGDVATDPKQDVVVIELPDGSVTVNLGGPKPIEKDDKFDANLADKLDDATRGMIASQLIRAIEIDDQSRSEWLATRAEGIKILGLTLEKAGSNASGSAPLEGMSTVRHPLLLEAVLEWQANAQGELLPSGGPVKVRDDGSGSIEGDQLATALQRDMNHYLTNDAPEYYPDTDRMLFLLAMGGCGFKKVYHCPIRRRPVSESVNAEDMIISNAATDMRSAPRLTQRIRMERSTLKRMQLVGAYRDIELATPIAPTQNAVDMAKERVSGLQANSAYDPAEIPRELYETYCELDIPGFEHKGKNGKPDGLPVPYKVTIDVSSQEILEIRRNWLPGDELCLRRLCFVKYPFVPGIGFYDIGLVHMLGNTANAATAGWREGLDAGMFANFPGFLIAKSGVRQNTSEFRVSPGSGVPVDTGGTPIRDAVMPLPYTEMGPAMMALINQIAETGRRVGGTANIAVGEGRQDAPVGTTIALIEQATKVMGAVHKRTHTAQAEELQLLIDLFREDPEAFWRNNRRSMNKWDRATLLKALDNYDLVPASDPNTASSVQRIGKAQTVYQMAKDNPDRFNQDAVYEYVFRAMQLGSATQFMKPAVQQGPDLKTQAEQMTAQAKMLDAKNTAAEIALRSRTTAMDDENRDLDRQTDEKVAAMGLAKAAIEKGTGSEAEQVLSGLQSATATP